MLDQVLKESKQSLSKDQFPILAIDYGEKRIGIAVSDSSGRIGSPITTIKRSRRKKIGTVIEEILSIASEYGANSFLLGLPFAFEEQHKAIQIKIKDFSEKLAQESKKNIYYYTEAYSSEEATAFLGKFVAVGSKDGKIDKMSAALFLQNFLDARNKNQSSDTTNKGQEEKGTS